MKMNGCLSPMSYYDNYFSNGFTGSNLKSDYIFNIVKPHIQIWFNPQWSSGHDFCLSLDSAQETRVRFVSLQVFHYYVNSNNVIACWGEIFFWHFTLLTSSFSPITLSPRF